MLSQSTIELKFQLENESVYQMYIYYGINVHSAQVHSPITIPSFAIDLALVLHGQIALDLNSVYTKLIG